MHAGRKEGIKCKEGRKERGNEGRQAGRKEQRKRREGRKEGRNEGT